MPGTGQVANSGDFAYQSLPVDVLGDGTYVFRFGPLEAAFDYPRSPAGLSYNFPSDFHFPMTPAGDPAVVQDGASRFLELSFMASQVDSPYIGMTGWVY